MDFNADFRKGVVVQVRLAPMVATPMAGLSRCTKPGLGTALVPGPE